MGDTDNNVAKRLDRRQLLKGSVAGGAALSLGAGAAAGVSASSVSSQPFGSESLPTGLQYQISNGKMSAIVTEEGATLRSLKVKGQEFLVTFPENQPTTFYHGQVLLPWANRIAGGQYVWNGVTQQLPLNDISHNSALHGLSHWLNWTVAKHVSDSITLTVVEHAQDGYPFVLAFSETYAITSRGFEVFTTARNIGTTTAPYGVGHHPYLTLSAGVDVIDTNILTLPAKSYFLTDANLIIKPPAVSVVGTPFNFLKPRAIGATEMDTNFADLIYDADGYTRTYLSTANGRVRMTLFFDGQHKYMQAYTSDTVPIASQIRKALVLEGYTGATNAFNNGLGLVVLKPGESITTHWGITIEL